MNISMKELLKLAKEAGDSQTDIELDNTHMMTIMNDKIIITEFYEDDRYELASRYNLIITLD